MRVCETRETGPLEKKRLYHTFERRCTQAHRDSLLHHIQIPTSRKGENMSSIEVTDLVEELAGFWVEYDAEGARRSMRLLLQACASREEYQARLADASDRAKLRRAIAYADGERKRQKRQAEKVAEAEPDDFQRPFTGDVTLAGIDPRHSAVNKAPEVRMGFALREPGIRR